MKIVDVSEFYAERGGGVRVYTLEKLRAGAKAGHEIVIVAPGPADRQQDCEGGRIVWVKSPPFPLDSRYYLLLREKAVHEILRQENPDVVEGSSPWTGGWFAARWPGQALKSFIFHQDPIAVYPQTFLGSRIGEARVDSLFAGYWFYLRRLSRQFNLTVVPGPWLATRLSRFGVYRPEPVSWGIDKSHFGPTQYDAELRQHLLGCCGVPEDAPLLITISRHHPEKRLGTLLSAVQQINVTHPLGLVIFGDGPLRPWLERRAQKTSGVYLAGFTKDRPLLARALASADALLHGSSAETYGLVVAEAICSGTPVVVPRQGGAHDLARPAYSESYPPGDATACSAAILRLLRRDRHQLQQACLEASSQVVKTMGQHFESLFDVYSRRL